MFLERLRLKWDKFSRFLNSDIKRGFSEFGKSMRGYLTNEAIPHANQERLASANSKRSITYEHLQIKMYPCGEGAGYAGGIISAAIDGEKCALMIGESLHKKPRFD
jgi:uncharacterized FAD-dependent dehydrogenase